MSHYCQRYRMTIGLKWLDPVPDLPGPYRWAAWSEDLVACHAEVEWRSFRNEFDARVFPNLGRLSGCYDLMYFLSRLDNFVPEAGWLIEAPNGCCGAIQGIRDQSGLGMIQNVGIVPEHRGRGLGRALLLHCLHGFRAVGIETAYLEVSARNRRALKLYYSVGFTVAKTFYREFVDAEPVLAGW